MNKKLSGKTILLIVLVLGAGTYFLYRDNKKRYVKTIISMNASGQPALSLLSFDEPFLKAWSAGLKNGKDVFEYNGKRYNTQGGKAAK